MTKEDNLTLDKSTKITDSMGEISSANETENTDGRVKYKPNVHKLVIWPDGRLRQACASVTKFDDDLTRLCADMFATMKHFVGIGIAAPQIGVMSRIVCVWALEKIPLVLINPVITERSEEMYTFEEGCLSIPGYYAERERPKKIVFNFQDVTGKRHEAEASDITAFVIQHECDHLDGITFVDHLSPLKRTWVHKKVTRALRHGNVNGEATDESVDPLPAVAPLEEVSTITS